MNLDIEQDVQQSNEQQNIVMQKPQDKQVAIKQADQNDNLQLREQNTLLLDALQKVCKEYGIKQDNYYQQHSEDNEQVKSQQDIQELKHQNQPNNDQMTIALINSNDNKQNVNNITENQLQENKLYQNIIGQMKNEKQLLLTRLSQLEEENGILCNIMKKKNAESAVKYHGFLKQSLCGNNNENQPNYSSLTDIQLKIKQLSEVLLLQDHSNQVFEKIQNEINDIQANTSKIIPEYQELTDKAVSLQRSHLKQLNYYYMNLTAQFQQQQKRLQVQNAVLSNQTINGKIKSVLSIQRSLRYNKQAVDDI